MSLLQCEVYSSGQNIKRSSEAFIINWVLRILGICCSHVSRQFYCFVPVFCPSDQHDDSMEVIIFIFIFLGTKKVRDNL